jgi:hypothetical protein
VAKLKYLEIMVNNKGVNGVLGITPCGLVGRYQCSLLPQSHVCVGTRSVKEEASE